LLAAYAEQVTQQASGLKWATLWLRRGSVLVLVGILVAVVMGAFGLHSGNARASADGYRLDVTYPAVARAGLDIVWTVQVEHVGGFGKQITLRVKNDYGTMFEHQNYTPRPTSETHEGRYDYLTFAAPSGDMFVFWVDADVLPASQKGRRAQLAVVDADHRPLVAVDYRTRLAS
jgi:hypothetical protein